MALFECVADLLLQIDSMALHGLELATGSGWSRLSTVVELHGAGQVGRGEDVVYESEDQLVFRRRGAIDGIVGCWRFAEFSRRLDELELFASPPVRASNRQFRRWAFESTGLDLALRQNSSSLPDVLGRVPAPIRYVVSCGLGSPASTSSLARLRAQYHDVEFKVDFSEQWSETTVRDLAALGGVTTVDLKAHYHGSFQGPAPDAELYRAIAAGLPDAWLEDPAWDGDAWRALEPYRARVVWDAVLHSVRDLEALPFRPQCINIKPSRFGTVRELLAVYEWCEQRGVSMYGGGQFELGPGRAQIQALASLFHSDGPNDVSPAGFHQAEVTAGMPSSPLAPDGGGVGFGDSGFGGMGVGGAYQQR